MSNLKSTIQSLANDFAMSIIGALRAASIDEITEVKTGRARVGRAPAAEGGGRRRGRLGRRSPADISRMVDDIVGVLVKHPDGMRAEDIRKALGYQAKEMPRPLKDAVAEGRITKSGHKRATTYRAGAGKRRGRKRAA